MLTTVGMPLKKRGSFVLEDNGETCDQTHSSNIDELREECDHQYSDNQVKDENGLEQKVGNPPPFPPSVIVEQT